MKKAFGIIFIVLAAGLIWFSLSPKHQESGAISILVSEEISESIQPAIAQFEKEFSVKVDRLDNGDVRIGEATAISKSGVREIFDFATVGAKKYVIGIADKASDSKTAIKLARYLTAPEKGGEVLSTSGLKLIAGDKWEEKPELVLYSGGVNRPAVEKLLEEFSEREGITLTTVFNGCGILCAAMQAMTDAENPRFPDAYYACDLCFVPPVEEHFNEVVLLTEIDIGIAVLEDNPQGIKTLADLPKPGLKVGLCNQKQSTLGYMTAGILNSSGLDNSIRKNLSVEVPTADFLITQLRSGALDAAIVYRVNAEIQKDHIHFIKINHEGARAVQPFSVRGDSDRKHLAKRLQNHFLAHPEAFLESGFTWRGDEGAVKTSDIEIPEWLRPRD